MTNIDKRDNLNEKRIMRSGLYKIRVKAKRERAANKSFIRDELARLGY